MVDARMKLMRTDGLDDMEPAEAEGSALVVFALLLTIAALIGVLLI